MLLKEVFTKQNIKILKSFGESEEDIAQIKRAYKKLRLEKNNKKITKEQAINELGIETFLSGLDRASFHWTTSRENKNGEHIYFDCSKLFEE